MAENKTTFKQNFMTDLKENPISLLIRTTYKYCKHNLHQRPISFVSSLVLGGAFAKVYHASKMGEGCKQECENLLPRNSNADDRRLIAPVPQKEESPSSSSDEEGEVGSQNHATSFHDGETKKIDSNESFWRINKTSEESSSAIKSICVRDMGTEMTPIASQEPSRNCTPIRATTPAGRSPISSRSSTPGRCPQGVQSLESYQTGFTSFNTRCEPVPFSRTSGEPRWPNREEEESNTSKMYENKSIEQATKPNPLEVCAIAWDEAERVKYMARYKREEVKIQAWENHEKRKAEMDMKRIEVKAERLKSRAQEKLSNKLAATR